MLTSHQPEKGGSLQASHLRVGGWRERELQLFEKLTRANYFQIEREKPYDYLY